MPEPDAKPASRFGRLGTWWLIGCGILFASWFPLGLADNATELVPDHSDVILGCFALGGLGAFVSFFVFWHAAMTWPTKNRIGFTLSCAFFTFLVISMAALPAAEIIEGWVDFPASKTETFDNVYVKITRAYQTHGKGRSWNIQTMPIWSNIDITRDDYEQMLSHRAPGDAGTDPDEIASHGYFCAKVVVQKAGDDALRIMHAGRGRLPKGSVIVCPADFEKQLHI